MIYELRIYSCLPGRLPNLLKRFETGTLALWDKHGIKQAGFFTTLVGPTNNDLTYSDRLGLPSPTASRNGPPSSPIPPGTPSATRAKKTASILANVASSFLTPTAFSSVK